MKIGEDALYRAARVVWRVAAGLSSKRESVPWWIKKYLTASSSRIGSPSPVKAISRSRSATLNYTLLHIGMKAGAVIPAHLYNGMAGALYVVEGDFTKEGQAGTSLHFKAGTPLRMDASCSSSGRSAPHMRPPISTTSLSKAKRPSGNREVGVARRMSAQADHSGGDPK